MFVEMRVGVILMLIAVCQLHSLPASSSPNAAPKRPDPRLLEVQTQIEKLSKKDLYMKLRFNRVAEIEFEGSEQLSLSQTEMIPSIGIPYKDNFYYTMILKKSNNYYSLKGDLIYSSPHSPAQNASFVVSSRNEFTYFAELQDTLLAFHRCRVANKKAVVELEHTLDLKAHSQMRVDSVFMAYHSGHKQLIVVDNRGRIVILDKNNSTLKEVSTEHAIRQVEKVNYNLVILTEQELMFLNLNKNASKVGCVLPAGSIDYFKFEDYNFRFVYGVSQGMMYQFQLAAHCRIVRIYSIPLNSSVQIASQIALIVANARHYALNLTTGELKPYRLPMGQCAGQQKFKLIRKIQTTYINSRICWSGTRVIVNLMSIELQEEEATTAEFSKFRIPLLLLSFGVIVYMTVRNQKKEKTTEQKEEEIRLRLFEQYPQLRQAAKKQELDLNKTATLIESADPSESIKLNNPPLTEETKSISALDKKNPNIKKIN